jgi:hypothetical protein
VAGHILEVAPKSAWVVFESDMVRVKVTMRKGVGVASWANNEALETIYQ